MQKRFVPILLLFGVACSDSVDPRDPDALSQVLVIPGAQREEGSPPAAGSGSGSQPVIQGGARGGLGIVESGNELVLQLDFTSASGYQDCYVQVIGASDYFRIPTDNSATSGQIVIPVYVPPEVETGEFDLYSCIQGSDGTVSNAIDVEVAVLNPEDYDPSNAQCVASGSCPAGGSIRSCATDDAICWYELRGQKFPCGPNCDCYNAAEAAAYYCIEG
jgi:hypothetical protein